MKKKYVRQRVREWPLQKRCVIRKLQQNLLFLIRKFVSRQCSDCLSNLSNHAYCSLTIIIIIIIIIIKGEFNLLNVQFSFFTLNLQKISNFSKTLIWLKNTIVTVCRMALSTIRVMGGYCNTNLQYLINNYWFSAHWFHTSPHCILLLASTVELL